MRQIGILNIENIKSLNLNKLEFEELKADITEWHKSLKENVLYELFSIEEVMNLELNFTEIGCHVGKRCFILVLHYHYDDPETIEYISGKEVDIDTYIDIVNQVKNT